MVVVGWQSGGMKSLVAPHSASDQLKQIGHLSRTPEFDLESAIEHVLLTPGIHMEAGMLRQ